MVPLPGTKCANLSNELDNVVDILKIIQMIGIDIQDNFDFGFRLKKLSIYSQASVIK